TEIWLSGSTGTVVVNQPVAPRSPEALSNPVPSSWPGPRGHRNIFPPAVHGGPAAHPQTRKLALFNVTGSPSSSYAPLQSGCPASGGFRIAKKVSLKTVHTNSGKSFA